MLVISHGHPAYTRGGSEIAAYTLHQALLAEGVASWFLGCRSDGGGRRLGVAITQPGSGLEYLYAPGDYDGFHFANRDPAFPAEFTALLRELDPAIVHFHHFIYFGIDAIHLVRQTLPQARIVLTLHEYLLICHAYGQMVTRRDHDLCPRATNDSCHACFPEHAPADFFLRTAYIRRFLALVDHFIAPSHFLATRLIAWGLPAARLSVIENPVHPATTPPAPNTPAPGPLRVGYFGQISALKGIAVLFAAARLLEDADIVFDIHGDHRNQPPEFQEAFIQLQADPPANVRTHGPYQPGDVDTLMRGVDLVLVPSIWWENSPVVIQEARRNRRPVICSAIGGMAEKVRPGQDGWHIPAGSAPALASLLRALASDRPRIAAMAAGLPDIAPLHSIVAAHRAVYNAEGTACKGRVIR